jgi:hypothetical protein
VKRLLRGVAVLYLSAMHLLEISMALLRSDSSFLICRFTSSVSFLLRLRELMDLREEKVGYERKKERKKERLFISQQQG